MTREPDLLRSGKARYRIVEPLVVFYESIMRQRWSELERNRAKAIWAAAGTTFRAKVVGPHFEALCREFVGDAATELFGEFAGQVGSGTVNDAANRTQIEVDVIALAVEEPNQPRRVLALGEAKWGEVIGQDHIRRLARARDLLAHKGFDVTRTVLAGFGGAGFTEDLTRAAKADDRLLLVDPVRMYRPSTGDVT